MNELNLDLELIKKICYKHPFTHLARFTWRDREEIFAFVKKKSSPCKDRFADALKEAYYKIENSLRHRYMMKPEFSFFNNKGVQCFFWTASDEDIDELLVRNPAVIGTLVKFRPRANF